MNQNRSYSRSGVGAGQLFMLDPWEEVPLAAIPSRSSVVLPQTQQQVQSQHAARGTSAVQLCRTVRHSYVLQLMSCRTNLRACGHCAGVRKDHLHAV